MTIDLARQLLTSCNIDHSTWPDAAIIQAAQALQLASSAGSRDKSSKHARGAPPVLYVVSTVHQEVRSICNLCGHTSTHLERVQVKHKRNTKPAATPIMQDIPACPKCTSKLLSDPRLTRRRLLQLALRAQSNQPLFRALRHSDTDFGQLSLFDANVSNQRPLSDGLTCEIIPPGTARAARADGREV